MERLLLGSNVALWAVVILQTLLILSLFRYLSLLLNRLPAQGPALGRAAPRREVVDIDGRCHVLGEASVRHQVLLFTAPQCPWCEKLRPDIGPFAASLGQEHDLLLVLGHGTPAQEARSYAQKLGGGDALRLAVAPELFESYAVPGTPYGLLIDKEGVVRTKGITNTLTDLQTLLTVPR